MNHGDDHSTCLLEAKDLGRKSRHNDWLIRNISLTIHCNDRIAVVGPSGAGKSLLLRALALLDPLNAGSIYWKGSQVSGEATPRFRREMIYVHQQPQLLEGTVDENLRLPFTFQVNDNQQFDRDKILEYLRSVGWTEDFLTKQQSNLSGGESALAAIIRAVQLDPEVLLLDEPTSAMDRDTTMSIESLVNRWFDSSASKAFVWVTHDDAQAERVSNRLLQIANGQLTS